MCVCVCARASLSISEHARVNVCSRYMCVAAMCPPPPPRLSVPLSARIWKYVHMSFVNEHKQTAEEPEMGMGGWGGESERGGGKRKI